jgi:hypothetical protein
LNNRSNIPARNINKLDYELKLVGMKNSKAEAFSMGSMGLGFYKDRFIHLDTRAVLKRESPVRWIG